MAGRELVCNVPNCKTVKGSTLIKIKYEADNNDDDNVKSHDDQTLTNCEVYKLFLIFVTIHKI